jgi:hypothetical protein
MANFATFYGRYAVSLPPKVVFFQKNPLCKSPLPGFISAIARIETTKRSSLHATLDRFAGRLR